MLNFVHQLLTFLSLSAVCCRSCSLSVLAHRCCRKEMMRAVNQNGEAEAVLSIVDMKIWVIAVLSLDKDCGLELNVS